MKHLQRLLRWLLLAAAETYICLVTIPHVLQSIGLARAALLGATFFLFSVGLGYFLVHSSERLDCWREAAWFGAFVYLATVAAIAVSTKNLILPAPHLFIVAGSALGGLLRWQRLTSGAGGKTQSNVASPFVGNA